MTAPHGHRAHAQLGASTAERWLNCSGSVALLEQAPPDVSSPHAREGTAAHQLAELCLLQQQHPEQHLGRTMRVTEGGTTHEIEVTEEMVDAVALYVNTVRTRIDNDGAKLLVEERISLAPLNPPAEMFGTADAMVCWFARGELHIFDLKYGSGVWVDVNDNLQLGYYALGGAFAWEDRYKEYPLKKVTVTIVQPRHRSSEPVRSAVYTRDELNLLAVELLAAAQQTQDPNAPLAVGDWCKWCRAKPICPAQKAHAEEQMQSEFALVPLSPPVQPTALTTTELAEILPKLDVVEDWMKAVRAYAQQLLEAGQDVPGWKLVQKRANRAWVNETDAAARLKTLLGDRAFVTELKSPAQIEKEMGKKSFAGLEAELVEKKSSGVTMAPTYDPRPAVTVAPVTDAFDTPVDAPSIDSLF